MQRVLEGGKAVEHPQASQTNMYPPGPETEALFAPLQKLREAVKPNEPMDLLAFKLQTCNALQRALDAKLDSKLTLPNFWKFLSLAQELARRDMAHMSLVLQVFLDLFNARPLEDCKLYWEILEKNHAKFLPVDQLKAVGQPKKCLRRFVAPI